jgi:hypothetical protein
MKKQFAIATTPEQVRAEVEHQQMVKEAIALIAAIAAPIWRDKTTEGHIAHT